MDHTVDRILHRAGEALHLIHGDHLHPTAPAGAAQPNAEQHIVRGCRVVSDNGVAVVIPPLFHQVITARLTLKNDPASLKQAQARLEQLLAALDQEYPDTPDGLCATVVWGLPYFRTYVAGPSVQYLPVDNRASAVAGKPVLAVLDAIRFPSDGDDVILEDNDVAVLLRSNSTDQIDDAMQRLFKGDLDFWQPTSIRKGFIGRGHPEGIGLPKQMATEAGVPGAELIPDGAQMFLGFTSSQKAALGSDMIANMESIPGLTDQWPNGYFRHGTTMHLSHLYEDIVAWYTGFNYRERVERAFRPGLAAIPEGTQTVPEGPAQIETEDEIKAEVEERHIVGHSATLQAATRLQQDMTDNYGNFAPQGSAIPIRGDFNTLDHPFSWSANPERDGWAEEASPGLHFLVFAPTSDAFHRGRMAMDGHYADGTAIPMNPRSRFHGMNSVLHTTHRQNFLVPGRAHRSFPLVELL